MPSFDVVSEVDMHQLTNAVDQAGRIVANRFDFKGVEASFERQERTILLTADNGASGEGGLTGTHNETYVLNGLQTPLAVNLKHYDRAVREMEAMES